MWGDDEGRISIPLLDGERIIWTGAPANGLLFTARDWLLIPFSLLWGGFAIFWESGVAQKGVPLFFLLWGVPFVLIGLFLIIGRFFADAWLRGRTRYALTNRRILIERGGAFPKFTALHLDTMPATQFAPGAAGRGTLRFGDPAPMWGRNGFGSWMPALDPTPQFLAIDDAQRVFQLIQRTLRSGQ
jgi:hypothetical protein